MSSIFSPLWSQFILAAALDRIAGRFAAERGTDVFCYADTHAGPGLAPFERDSAAFNGEFVNQAYPQAVALSPDNAPHPGSWVIAERVLGRIFPDADDFEIDVNDIDSKALDRAKVNHESGRLRLWSYDWFKFLRSRLAMARPPNFVFIDLPDDDPRGPEFAINAALLLDTVKCPFLIATTRPTPQFSVNLIGRTILELTVREHCLGAILGGGAETILLPLLPDLRKIATLLNGGFTIHTPHDDDYTI